MNNKVLLISIDNLRYDCAGYVGEKAHLKKFHLEKLVNTPTLDEISSNAAIFTNCFSTCTYTPPAHASLFTGLYPPKHGVRPFFYKTLSPDCVTIAEIYKNNGYKTAFYSDVFGLFGPMGLDRGFDYKFDKNFDDFIKLLTSFKDEKVFAFVHLFDIHEPFIFSECPPDLHYNDDYIDFIKTMSELYNIPITQNNPYAMWNAFAASVRFDQSIMLPPYIYGVNKFDEGRFKSICGPLKSLNYFDGNNIFAIFSDHGEGRISLINKPVFGHMGELFDEVIHIPLIFHAPGIENKVYDKLASIADIYPTLISLSGLGPGGTKTGGGIDGINLFEKREYCYSEYFIQNMNNEIMQFNAAEFDRNKRGASIKDTFVLAQQGIRTDNKKYIFMQDRMPFKEVQEKFIENLKLSDEDYIISLFNFVLRKRIDKSEYLQFLNLLKTKKATRMDLYNAISTSIEYGRPLNYYYDLAADPFEEKPLVFSNINLTDVDKYKKLINELENEAVYTEDCFANFSGGAAGLQNKAKPVNGGDSNCSDIELLKSKISFSEEIIREAHSRFGEKIAIAFTGGKDSTVLLDLIRKIFNGTVPFKVINIDTSAEFPEIIDFRDKLKQAWGFDLRIYANKEAATSIVIAENRQECCNLLKTTPLKNAVKDLSLKGLMTGIRKDEQAARAGETYFSKREHPHHYRIHPMLHFTEADIWNYIKLNNLPFCSLYEQGYRSIDCMPCTKKGSAEDAERAGRSAEKEAVMGRLRDLGYF
jgi:phosphoadenosine phosphosulfate reductase